MDNLTNEIAPEVKKEALPTVTPRDFAFLAIFFALSLFLSYTSFASLGLGFALSIPLLLVASLVYLKGKLVFSAVSYISLVTSFVIAASFLVHGANTFSQFKILFLTVSVSVFFISASGFDKARLDRFDVVFSPITFVFEVGFTNASKVTRACFRKESGIGTKALKILLALLCVIPLAIVLVSLLAWSDAAFEGFIDAFKFDTDEIIGTAIGGVFYFAVIFPLVFAIDKRMYKESEKPTCRKKGIESLYVNTVLTVVSIIYLLFIITQFSYVFNSFAGLLPKEFTYSEYARRGFGEMCVICVINFAIIAVTMAKTERNEGEELSFLTKLLLVFISSFSIFLVIVAIAKMFMYIQNYGLTFLRLGPSIFMLFLFVVFISMIVKIFKPYFAHVRIMIAAACIIMTVTSVFDPYALIASYNTYAYESGMHDTIDTWYLREYCGDYGVPKMIKLTEDADLKVAECAKDNLDYFHVYEKYNREFDWREFSLSNCTARNAFNEYRAGT